MYVPFQDATRLPISFDAGSYTHGDVSVPRLDAIAARETDGKVWLALTNVDPGQPLEIDASLAGIESGRVSGTVLTADEVDAINTYAEPDTVVPKPMTAQIRSGRLRLTLPPKSVTVLSVTP